MNLSNEGLKLYQAINFCSRYEALSRDYQFEERLEYTNDKVIKVIEELGYNSKFVKSDQFFKIENKEQNVKFYFHICLKYSNVELILGAVDIKTDKFLGGSVFGRIYKLVKLAENNAIEDNIKMPKFRNYDDLKDILKKAFAIYEDFKKELLRQTQTE